MFLTLTTLLSSIPGYAQPVASTPDLAAPLNTEVLRRDNHCGRGFSEPAAIWIDKPHKLKDLYARLATLPSPTLPTVDFAKEGVLLITMGQRPTGGYGLDFKPDSLRLKVDTLEVAVIWQEPAPGYRQFQMITYPCLLLKLPAVVFQRIQVVDQSGRVRVSAKR